MSISGECPICAYKQATLTVRGSSLEFECVCKRCGRYFTTHEFVTSHDEKYKGKWHLLSGLVREINEEGNAPDIMYKALGELFADSRIPQDDDVQGKARKILSYLKRHSQYYGSSVSLNLEEDISIGYAKNHLEFDALIRLLRDSNLLEGGFPKTSVDNGDYIDDEGVVTLTAEGWQVAKNENVERLRSLQGFIAIRFDDDADPYIEAIENAIRATGYQPQCIKEKHYPERVMDKAIGEIRRSRFIVVDLTQNRCAVSFESGFAYALGIECIPVWQKGTEKVEDFYSKHYKYIEYTDATDLQKQVEEAIRARIPLPKEGNPST
ncbi:MAG: hypothetical protein PHX87_05045 [Candidatus Peribacteraceae bacterium]|nr:hypothetical protein [Candidatus Peribacteraceae bacterium]MDD5742762.1 hypothetical protein [Candidatus Peribacteraceae bacterium]